MNNCFGLPFIMVCLFPIGIWSADYYVNGVSGMDDGNKGTSIAPLKTINAALAKVKSGDTIFITSAIYRETLKLHCSGITLRAQTQADVRIKGSDLDTNWTLYRKSVWQSPWTVNSQQVFVDSIPLQQIGANSPFQTTKNRFKKVVLPPVGNGLDDMTAGSFYYNSAASKLYVWLSDGSDPHKHTIEASVRNFLIPFNENLNDIHLIDLQFYHSNMTSQDNYSCMVNVGGQNWLINHCTFNDGDFGGLAVQGTGHQIINCACNRNGDVGLKICGSDIAHKFKAWPDRPPQKILVSNCQTNYNNYRNFERHWEAGGMKNITSCREITILQCRSSFNNGPGIWFDGGARNNFIYKCIVTDNKGSGIEYEISDSAIIANNLVLRNNENEGDGGIFISSSDYVLVYNNTIHENRRGIFLGHEDRREHPTMANNLIRNNILSLNKSIDIFMYIDSATAPAPGNGNNSDYNLFYRLDKSAKIIYYTGKKKVTSYRNLSIMTNSTGMEKNSRYGNPLYVDTVKENFNLTQTPKSPAIGTAEPVDLSSKAIVGNPLPKGLQEDMGAFQISERKK